MSRIKDALKRAKNERSGAERFSITTPQPERSARAPQTRVINYSEDAVIRHKIITPYFADQDLAEHFKLLRTRIFAETQKHDDRTILITSSLPKEGKTFLAVNLAITFAREVDQTVLLVDVNLKSPSVLKCFGIDEQPGLIDYLKNDIPLSDLLVRPGIEQLVLLPTGTRVENSAELLRSRKMHELIREMKHRYGDRYIFFDGPPLLDSVDSIVLSEFVDRTIFVVESGRVKQSRMSEALGRIEKRKMLGAVFNKRMVLNF